MARSVTSDPHSEFTSHGSLFSGHIAWISCISCTASSKGGWSKNLCWFGGRVVRFCLFVGGFFVCFFLLLSVFWIQNIFNNEPSQTFWDCYGCHYAHIEMLPDIQKHMADTASTAENNILVARLVQSSCLPEHKKRRNILSEQRHLI